MNMILLLGKNDVVEEYAETVLNTQIVYCPFVTTHYTEFNKCVDAIKRDNPPVVNTQSLEMIEVLLKSDLDFEVVTVKRFDDGIRAATRTKEYVVDCRGKWNFDPRG